MVTAEFIRFGAMLLIWGGILRTSELLLQGTSASAALGFLY